MPRYALKVEYVGTGYAGWQRQANVATVQGTIEDALAHLEDDVPSISAAGRTDAGVHALGQVAHCDLVRDWDPFRLSEALNYHLKPSPIAIVAAALAPPDWHARFSATGRAYIYRIAARRAPLTHDASGLWRVPGTLDTTAMADAAQYLLGKHDFTTFRSVECQAESPVKTLDRLEVSEQSYPGGTEYRFDVRARSFLHNQVRSFVGTLERVGAGKWAAERVKTALEARNRAACGPVAPSDGLYLSHVTYEIDPFAH